jgi:hypothetical protein
VVDNAACYVDQITDLCRKSLISQSLVSVDNVRHKLTIVAPQVRQPRHHVSKVFVSTLADHYAFPKRNSRVMQELRSGNYVPQRIFGLRHRSCSTSFGVALIV